MSASLGNLVPSQPVSSVFSGVCRERYNGASFSLAHLRAELNQSGYCGQTAIVKLKNVDRTTRGFAPDRLCCDETRTCTRLYLKSIRLLLFISNGR